MDVDVSAAAQVAALKVGECYARTRFIAAPEVTPEAITKAKRDLSQITGPTVARAREREPTNLYRTHTVHTFTRDLDAVITAIIVREGAI